jgi:hypothetical protein
MSILSEGQCYSKTPCHSNLSLSRKRLGTRLSPLIASSKWKDFKINMSLQIALFTNSQMVSKMNCFIILSLRFETWVLKTQIFPSLQKNSGRKETHVENLEKTFTFFSEVFYFNDFYLGLSKTISKCIHKVT